MYGLDFVEVELPNFGFFGTSTLILVEFIGKSAADVAYEGS